VPVETVAISTIGAGKMGNSIIGFVLEAGTDTCPHFGENTRHPFPPCSNLTGGGIRQMRGTSSHLLKELRWPLEKIGVRRMVYPMPTLEVPPIDVEVAKKRRSELWERTSKHPTQPN
jgi:hypothetical protein